MSQSSGRNRLWIFFMRRRRLKLWKWFHRRKVSLSIESLYPHHFAGTDNNSLSDIIMATALAQPDRSTKQRVFQAPEKKPPSSGHAITSVTGNSGLHAHEKVRVSPGVQHSV